MSINVTKEDLFNMILKLQEQVDLLIGKPRGPITMTEYRLACERKDKAMIRRYLEQEEKGFVPAGAANSSAPCSLRSGEHQQSL